MKRIERRPRVPGAPKASDRWRTEPALFRALHAEFGFQVDLAADGENTLLDRWLGPGGFAADALAVAWSLHWRRGYLNAPYSAGFLDAFLAKAVEEAAQGFTTVALTPYTPDVRWWRRTDDAAEIREIPHRVGYLTPDGQAKAGAMFASAALVFRPQPGVLRGQPRRVVWDYPRETRRKGPRT